MKSLSHSYEDMVELATFDNGFLINCTDTQIDPANITNEIQRVECMRYSRKNPKPEPKMYPRYGKCSLRFIAITQCCFVIFALG